MSSSPLNSDSQPDSLDHALDLALASYTPAEPRLGLENRVRARLVADASTTQSRAPFSMQRFWVATGIFAAAILLVALLRTYIRAPQPNHGAIHQAPSVPVVPVPQRLRTAALPTPSRRSPANRIVSQRSTPLVTQQEPTQQQLIARLMANGSEAIAVLAKDDDKLDKPINIELLPDDPLVIEPIKVTPIDDNPAEPSGKF
jgi:hypothetical protein